MISTHSTESQPAREELENLARNAPSPAPPPETYAQDNKRLAAGLDRVRGEAIHQAKAANKRLRRRGTVATAASFAIGVSLGYFLSTRHV